MNPTVVFSLLARRKLRQQGTRAAATNPNALTATMSKIEAMLRQVFPTGSISIVQDVYVSYRTRAGEHILLVEVTQAADRDGLYVVKFSDDPSRLSRELEGWTKCRPDGLRHDLVLTTLEGHRDASGQLIALVYSDADQIIAVDQTVSLEQAMLDCVRFGVPTPESVAECLFLLYERLGLLLYRNSYTDDPLNPTLPISPERLDHRLQENIDDWNAGSVMAFDVRATANTAADNAGLSGAYCLPTRSSRRSSPVLARTFPECGGDIRTATYTDATCWWVGSATEWSGRPYSTTATWVRTT